MNFISKIPKPVLISLASVVSFMLVDLVTSHLYRQVPMPWAAFALFLFVTSLPGIVAALVMWFTTRKTQKNSWAVATITGFAMHALFIALTPLLGSWIAYVALILIVMGLLFANSRMLSGNRLMVLKFSLIFRVCATLWLLAHVFAEWIFQMRSV